MRGMTLLEVLFGVSVFLIAFLGFFALFQVSIDTVSNSKARAGAIALANEKMEQVRSLPYASVGTLGGIPSGALPQEEELSLNGTSYTRRLLIQYVDAPEDGSGGTDENGIVTDYKRVKVDVSWVGRGVERSYGLVSSVVPRGIESNAGGGTLVVRALDASALPLSGARVHIYRSGATTIDVTTYTGSEGRVVFPGSPEGGGYEITVDDDGYSTARTYAVTAENVNPSPGHLSVLEGQTTTGTFFIDVLTPFVLRTLKPLEAKEWTDTFSDSSGVGEALSVEIQGGAVSLVNGSLEGQLYAATTAPAYLAAWGELSFADVTPAQTVLRYHLYFNSGGVRALVPDAALPGNAAGFTSSPISLDSLSSAAYPSLIPMASFTSEHPQKSPSLQSWTLTWDEGPTPLPNISFTLRGTKTIGTRVDGSSIYKYEETKVTNASGVFSEDLEWDAYTARVDASEGYDIAESCEPQPAELIPGENASLELLLVPKTDNSLLLSVRHATSSALIEGVSVRLFKSGFTETVVSGNCGQSFFGDLAAGTYSLEMSKAGFATATTQVEITGASAVGTSLSPL